MTKLEQKLQELGYEYYIFDCCYKKKFDDYIYLIINIVDDKVNELDCGIEFNRPLTIELLKMTDVSQQQAFNEMKNDLEELKKCQD